MLARAKRQKFGNPRTEPQLGNDPDEVDVLEDRDRVLIDIGGDGGGASISLSNLIPFTS